MRLKLYNLNAFKKIFYLSFLCGQRNVDKNKEGKRSKYALMNYFYFFHSKLVIVPF